MNSNVVLLSAILIGMVVLSACSESNGTDFVPPEQTPSETPTPPSIVPNESIDLQTACEDAQGNWISDANECEWISEQLCDDLGGTFVECGSACRHDPDAEFCIMMCVSYCAFE